MESFVCGDHHLLASALGRILNQQTYFCPAANILSLAGAAELLPKARPGLIVVGLSPNPERALDTVKELRARLTQARILAVGPVSNLDLFAQALRDGADAYVNEDEAEAELPHVLLHVRNGRRNGG